MPRKAGVTQDFISPEQVLEFYRGNEVKAKAAMVEAELEGSTGLISDIFLYIPAIACRIELEIIMHAGCARGSKQDPNLKNTPGARVYRLVTRDSLEDLYAKKEETKSKVVPLTADPRQGARDLLLSLYPSCIQIQVAARSPEP